MRKRSALLAAAAVLAVTGGVATQLPASASATTAAGAPRSMSAYMSAAASALAADTGLTPSQAAGRLAAQDDLSSKALAFRKQHMAATPGVWIDVARGEAHANVTTSAAARAARQAGVVPHTATYAATDLKRVKDQLDAAARELPPNSSWHVDDRDNRVVIDLPSGTDATSIMGKAGIAKADREKIKVTTHKEKTSRYGLAGGDGLRIGKATCSAGIMVNWSGTDYLVTAGHCVQTGDRVERHDGSTNRRGENVGTVEERQFPYSDYALVRVNSPREWFPSGHVVNKYDGGFNSYDDYIRNPRPELTSGSYVCTSGVTSGWKCGKFQEDGEAWKDSDGHTTYNLIKAKVSNDEGDSGGAAIYGTKAVGTIVGGRIGGEYTYIQPLSTVIQNHGGDNSMRVVDWQQ
ncbi:S1 family peptidase [Streptomyces hiroshimensis]|nr:S1 family peptidase [Streptomyces hiroshimensis]